MTVRRGAILKPIRESDLMTLQATMSGRCNVYLLGLLTDGACRAKRFIAAWRVLVGVWMPKRLDMSASAVAQYTNPKKPPRSVWIDKAPQEKEITDFQLQPEPPVKARSARRPPSRRSSCASRGTSSCSGNES